VTPEEEQEYVTTRLRQNVVMDLCHNKDPLPIMRRAGLVPPSTEGLKIARAESEHRLACVAPLVFEVNRLAQIVSEMVMHIILSGDGEKPPPEVVAEAEMQNAMLIRIGTLIVIAHLLEADILHYSERVVK